MNIENIQFSKEELARYNRHIIIPTFGLEGQKKLKAARVLVVGTGGLGSPLLLYLAAAGVGHLGIVDFDVVDESNLQRQVLYSLADVGKPKVEAAQARIQALNPHIEITTYNTQLNSSNALALIKEYDLVADGTDNFPTRYLVNDACVFTGKPNVYASIFQFDGQVSVFNYQYPDGSRGPNYRDLYAEPPPPGLVPSCAEGGVLGVLPGIIGSIQALEVIKVITGVGEPLAGKLFSFDALSFQTRTLRLHKDPNNPVSGTKPTITQLIDYEQFCGLKPLNPPVINEIDVHQFKEMVKNQQDFQLIDVREPHEYEIVNLGGELIPLATVIDNQHKIAKDKPVVVHCKMGGRSATAIKVLQELGFNNLYNLKGGVIAYANEIDTTLPKY